MKALFVLGLGLLLSLAAFAQRGGGGNTYGSFSGFGSVVFPGTGHPPPPGGFSVVNPGFPARLGATVNGTLNFRRGGAINGRRSVGILPYAYPVYVGNYGYVGDPYATQDQPPMTFANPPQAAPQVIINQHFYGTGYQPADQGPAAADPNSGLHIYEAPARGMVEEPAAENRYYLIAYKDHSIYTALAYWVEDKTLHYVTTQNTHNQASLDLIDIDLTKKLNTDRRMAFSVN